LPLLLGAELGLAVPGGFGWSIADDAHASA